VSYTSFIKHLRRRQKRRWPCKGSAPGVTP